MDNVFIFQQPWFYNAKAVTFFPPSVENILSLRSVLSDPWQATLSRDN
uniref:Uncharacterized protein n=1 Tax=Anguilla anguilla TaxID=7936 RepID=A0A0E9SFE5_ANGAN